jgi:hypothetical protein
LGEDFLGEGVEAAVWGGVCDPGVVGECGGEAVAGASEVAGGAADVFGEWGGEGEAAVVKGVAAIGGDAEVFEAACGAEEDGELGAEEDGEDFAFEGGVEAADDLLAGRAEVLSEVESGVEDGSGGAGGGEQGRHRVIEEVRVAEAIDGIRGGVAEEAFHRGRIPRGFALDLVQFGHGG